MEKGDMRRIGLCVATAVAAVGLVGGCSGAEDADGAGAGKGSTAATARQGGAAGEGAEDAAKRDVKITDSGYQDHEVWGPHAYVVRYVITNGGKGAADYFAQFEFLDREGDVLGSTGVTADKLGAGKTHRGDAAPLEAEITNGSIKDIKSVRVSAVDRTPVK
ncbi:hypothetical protein ACFC09_15345 [Streptomyces sp. NPDC056161]|uniref:hypothetical protein n=1 Tax=Streptomyces sp. NPDC056161 TaxID=3345732 RepID=UPI0035DB0AF9